MKQLLFFLLLLLSTATIAQDSTYVSVELKNGKSVSGQLIHKSEAEVTVATKDIGKVTLAWSAIKSINMISKEGKGQNTHSTRYFFAPSAIPLKKGDKYYQNALFLVNSFQAGLTDHFSIGGGLVVPFALFITPKIGYQVADKVHVGGGIGGRGTHEIAHTATRPYRPRSLPARLSGSPAPPQQPNGA